MKMQAYIAESSDSESESDDDDEFEAWLALCALTKLTLGPRLNLQDLQCVSDLECDKLFRFT